MKITLTVTKAELQEIISEQLEVKVDNLVIVKSPSRELQSVPITSNDIESKMRQEFPFFNSFGDHMDSQGRNRKIDCIKHLRTLIPGMGLGEAKNAIENWAIFKVKFDSVSVVKSA